MRFRSLYLDRDTPLHRLHPATKILCLLLLFAGPLSFTHPAHLAALGAIIVAIGLAAGFGPNLRRTWRFMLFFFVVCVVLWMPLAPGRTVLFRVGALKIWRESFLCAVGMGLRIELFLLIALLFTSLTRIEELTTGLTRLGLPYRASFALSLAFRLAPMFLESGAKVIQAQQCRGLDPTSGNLFQRIRKLAPIFIPVFMGALRSGDALALAIESRGFGARPKRTCYMRHVFGVRDVAALLSVAALAGACLWLRATGHGGIPLGH